jgi:hypothetical protein
MLIWSERSPGTLEFILDLKKLYPLTEERSRFEQRWKEFYMSDKDNPAVFRKRGDILTYLSEEIIPAKKDDRPGLLLIFGNPAPCSVIGGICFASEAGKREHRVWRIFKDVGIVDLQGKRNDEKRSELLNLAHVSKYRVGMAVFFSISSTASKMPWTGVAGLKRLFGKKAFDKIRDAELMRMELLIRSFCPRKIIVFQKDAYDALRHHDVYKSPPTRLLQGKKAKAELQNILKE